MIYFDVSDLWVMAGRGKQPRGVERVVLELAHELTCSGRARAFVQDPYGGKLKRAPSDWFDAARLYTHENWSGVADAPSARELQGRGLRRFWRRPNLPDLGALPHGAVMISLGHPETSVRLSNLAPQTPLVAMIHDVTTASANFGKTGPRQRALATATRRLCAQAQRVLTPSALSQNRLAELTGFQDAHVLPLAYVFRRVAEPMPVDLPQQFFLHVGPLKHWKNGTRLLAAYHEARARRPDLPKLVVAGRVKGPPPAHVHFVPSPTHAQMQTLYENTSGLIMPSLSEGFALPLGEALSFGKPVSHTNILRPLRPPAKGWIGEFDGTDTGAIAQALLALADADGAALTLRRSWADVADELCATVSRL